jgi:hypothetical protein
VFGSGKDLLRVDPGELRELREDLNLLRQNEII